MPNPGKSDDELINDSILQVNLANRVVFSSPCGADCTCYYYCNYSVQ